MRIVSERKLGIIFKRCLSSYKEESLPFKRGDYKGKILLERYENVISVGVELTLDGHYVDTNYKDVIYGIQAFDNVLRCIEKLYRLSDLGVFIQLRMWENKLPTNVYSEDVLEYLGIDREEYELAVDSEPIYKYNKVLISVRGLYNGEKIIKLLVSKRTLEITHIFSIEEV